MQALAPAMPPAVKEYSVVGLEGRGKDDEQSLVISVGVSAQNEDQELMSKKEVYANLQEVTINTGGDHPAAMEMLRRNLRAASYAFGGFNSFGVQRVFSTVDTDNSGNIEIEVGPTGRPSSTKCLPCVECWFSLTDPRHRCCVCFVVAFGVLV